MDETESGHFKATSTQHATLSDHPDLRSIHATSTSTSDDVEIDNVPADRGSRPRRNTVRFADNNEVVRYTLTCSCFCVLDPDDKVSSGRCFSRFKPACI